MTKGESTSDTSRGDTDNDLESRLNHLAPVVNLLDRAREAVVGPGEQPTPEPPSHLDDFELLSPIGRGGMGVVYEARQRSLDRIVAIKVLPKSVVPETQSDSGRALLSPTSLIQRFHTEARAAARLHHPSIVPVFGFGEADGFYYFVMQRIYGQSLDRWINTHVSEGSSDRLGQQELVEAAVRFGFQTASGLAYAHREGVLHRDIKPGNLLIDEEGALQIADFGVARIDDAEALTRTSDVIGTLRYMAPEQIAGESVPQSDVYSLGVTLYEIVTGKPAVDDASVRQAILLQKKPRGPAPIHQVCPDLPLDLRTIIEKAMAPELSRRYNDAAALADDLDRFSHGRPIRARPLAWWERSALWIRRNQSVSALSALLFLALAMVAIVSVVGQVRLGGALRESETAKNNAEVTADLAIDAMERVFHRFSSSMDSTSLVYDATDFSVPAVDPTTAALLEDLITYYDSLGKLTEDSSGTSPTRSLQPGEAWMNVGAIYQQLGKHESAINAFSKSLGQLAPEAILLRARVQNQIGISYESLGGLKQSKPFHHEALAMLEADEQRRDSPEFRFEIARSRLLIARRPRPGMGPNTFPTSDAFRRDPWRHGHYATAGPPNGPIPYSPSPSSQERRGPERRLPERRGPDFRGPDPGRPQPRGPQPGGRERPGPEPPPPARPSALMRTLDIALLSPSAEEKKQFSLAIEELQELRREYPGSLPVTLLLSNVVRQSFGDILVAFEHVDEEKTARLWDLAVDIETELAAKLDDQSWEGKDAAIAYELVQLLSDFSVFRKLDPPSLRHGLRRLERAIPIIEDLVLRYPNVPAYENLAVHAAFKRANLESIMVGHDLRGKSDAERVIRSSLRQALKREQRLYESTPGADGYALWCSLIALRLGELQLRTNDGQRAAATFRRGLLWLPIHRLIDETPQEPSNARPLTLQPEQERAIRYAAIALLREFDHALGPDEPFLGTIAGDLSDRLEASEQVDWQSFETDLNRMLGP